MKALKIILVCLLMTLAACSPKAKRTTATNEEMWRKASLPGEHHQIFRDLHGNWETKITYWPEPGAEPTQSRGQVKSRLILGGLFLQEDFLGRMYGRVFTGLGVMGYDNIQGNYTSFWVDSMSSAMSFATGTYDQKTKRFEFRGSYTDPATRKQKKTRSVLAVPNRDLHRFEFFEEVPGGEEFKTLEVEYSRTGQLVVE